MATGHLLETFDGDLAELRALVARMGGLAEEAIDGAITALAHRDAQAAAQIVEADRALDKLEMELERQVVRLIALRSPLADDLREVLAALKIAGVIERIGDYAKNIAKRVPLLEESHAIEPIAILPAMARATAQMVHDALDAYAGRDAQAAVRICASDRIVDDFYNSIFRALLTYMMENPHTISASAHLLFVAKNLERIGDHATNIAEMVYFAATGEQMAERGRGADHLAPLVRA